MGGCADAPDAQFAAAQALLCGSKHPAANGGRSIGDAVSARVSFDLRESLMKEQRGSRGSHARDSNPLGKGSSRVPGARWQPIPETDTAQAAQV